VPGFTSRGHDAVGVGRSGALRRVVVLLVGDQRQRLAGLQRAPLVWRASWRLLLQLPFAVKSSSWRRSRWAAGLPSGRTCVAHVRLSMNPGELESAPGEHTWAGGACRRDTARSRIFSVCSCGRPSLLIGVEETARRSGRGVAAGELVLRRIEAGALCGSTGRSLRSTPWD